MTLTKKITVSVIVVLVGLAGVYAYYVYAFSSSIAALLDEQRVRNEAVKPLFDAVVTKKLSIGDSLEKAKGILDAAGLHYTVVRRQVGLPMPHAMLQSIYRAGPNSGFSIQLELDSDDRIAKIDIREYFTGP